MRVSYPRLKTIDGVFEWFMELDQPYWVLYRGHQKDRKTRTHVITENITLMSPEASWEKLERNIRAQAIDGGDFTILVTEKAKSNYGKTTFVVLSPEVLPATLPSQQPVQSINGIPLNAIGGIQGYVDNQIAAKTLQMQLEFQNQRLQERIEQLENAGPEKLGERLIEYFMANGDKYLDKLVQLCAVFKGGGSAVKVAMNGPPIPNQETENTMKEFQQPQSQEELVERLKSAQERITKHVHILLVLENLADLIEQNPEKVVALIQDKTRLTTLANML